MKKKKNKKFILRALSMIERVGNFLPHPGTLFFIFAVLILLISGVASFFDWSAIHPKSGELITVNNLLSRQGLHKIMLNMVKYTTDFVPLGVVMVAMLGIGITEKSGFITTAIRMIIQAAPRRLVTFILIFAGIMSNLASEIGYVLVIPLGAVVFLSVNRHPIAGMAAAFAGVSGGYSANLIIGTLDPMLAGISTEAAQMQSPDFEVSALGNWYFLIVSTFIILFVGTWITEKIVEPRLGKYKADKSVDIGDVSLRKLTKDEKKGMIWATITTLILIGVILWGLLPQDGFFRNLQNATIIDSPVVKGVVSVIFFAGAIIGIVYGFVAKTLKSDADVMKGMGDAMKTLGAYFVIVFFAAQFINYFTESNLGLIFSVKGGEFLASMNIGIIPLMVAFIILSGTVNMFIGSASAKWAMMAPIFVPMFMILGYSPELTQMAFRIGDSVTNIITPMMSYFALIVVFFKKYEPKAGIGSIVATMLPYSFAFFIAWTVLLIVWILLGLDLGPQAGLYFVP